MAMPPTVAVEVEEITIEQALGVGLREEWIKASDKAQGVKANLAFGVGNGKLLLTYEKEGQPTRYVLASAAQLMRAMLDAVVAS